MVDAELVTLLPGETHTFEVPGATREHAEPLSRRAVRCTNDVATLVDT